jgi:hypothetical protein
LNPKDGKPRDSAPTQGLGSLPPGFAASAVTEKRAENVAATQHATEALEMAITSSPPARTVRLVEAALHASLGL